MRVSRFHRFEVVAVLVLTTAVWGYDQSLGPLGSFLLSERFGAVPVRMVAAWHAFREQGLSAPLTPLPFLLRARHFHAIRCLLLP